MASAMARKQKLITKTLERTIPKLYATQHDRDPIVRVKLFTPDANFTWFITEYDPKKRLAFGYVEQAFPEGAEGELGYFSIDEIEQVRGAFGLPVERDQWFRPGPLSKVRR